MIVVMGRVLVLINHVAVAVAVAEAAVDVVVDNRQRKFPTQVWYVYKE